ncbi:MAG: glutathione-regulated potassium-efflux system ancillary protein KefC [Candidatus Omnitrophota bacterium]|jgi:glutathione-regulated potassium-efflux system ancillary protein KefC
MSDPFHDIGLIVVCSAVIGWFCTRVHQPIILGYLIVGICAGPSVFGLVDDAATIESISHIGVTLLLFLAGLVLEPHKLIAEFKLIFSATAFGGVVSSLPVVIVMKLFGYGWGESILAAIALTFSSTILIVKLMPTRTLHHKRMGSLSVGILVLQDILAVVVIMFITATGSENTPLFTVVNIIGRAVLLIVLALLFERYVLRKMVDSSKHYLEMMNILYLGWCLGMALMAKNIGLSYEIGAFVAGVSLARNKLSLWVHEELKPLRDFFLMLFFFALGAGLDLSVATSITLWLPGIIVSASILILRPWVYRLIFARMGETETFSKEIGLRLGQASEFALIIALTAQQAGKISASASQFIQLTAITTIAVSAYMTVKKCYTPLGIEDQLKLD